MELNFYTLCVIYLVYSFLGWVAETVAATVKGRAFVNRGVASGPFCFVYGTAAVLMAVGFADLRSAPLALFLGCAADATVVEWVTAKLLERMHRRRWWDYSDYKFNLNGRICLLGAFVFGVGGVGGYTVEALARSGVGHFVLVDDDKVCLTNINRQIIATRSSVGKYKVDVMKERILDINPKAEVEVYKCFYLPENADDFDFSKYSYVVDAVDTVTAKIEIIMRAKACNVPVISCMGAGNKLDPTKFRVADIYKTNMCPLAKVMRREMKKRGVKKLKVVYSEEKSLRPLEDMSISCRTNCICPPGAARKCTERRDIPGSVAFVPSVAGLILAGEVIKDLSGVRERRQLQ